MPEPETSGPAIGTPGVRAAIASRYSLTCSSYPCAIQGVPETRVCRRRRARCRSRPRRGSGRAHGARPPPREPRPSVRSGPSRPSAAPSSRCGGRAAPIACSCAASIAREAHGGFGVTASVQRDVLVGVMPPKRMIPGPSERAVTRLPRSAYWPIWSKAAASKERPRKACGTGGPGARRLIVTATGSGGWASAAAALAHSVSARQRRPVRPDSTLCVGAYSADVGLLRLLRRPRVAVGPWWE